ncbi:DUF3526 domain-containing protein [Comamonas thiooxydans]|nr:DUF3526 domain-containing protein [Comamonas thiooxydans]
MTFPLLIHWKAEGMRLRRHPLSWLALGTLLLVLLATSISAGLDARSWRKASAHDSTAFEETLRSTIEKLKGNPTSSPANAIATYQLGRGELGSTRMPVKAGLGLGTHRLEVLPVQLKASLDSRQLEARDPGPIKNPLLIDTGLPGVPALAALLIPLVTLLLCSGLLQEEREYGRLALARVQAVTGMPPILMAALGWRFMAIWAVSALATAPALVLDPDSTLLVHLQWLGAVGLFCLVWVAVGGLLSCLPMSGATSMLLALGIWLTLTFAVPAGITLAANNKAPTPSRLKSIVAIRDAQNDSEDNEQALAKAWYEQHPNVDAHLPAVWPASFLPRVLDQDLALTPVRLEFSESRAKQADIVSRWSWMSPGLALVLYGEKLAGTDAASYSRYVNAVDSFEHQWRQYLIPHVMNRQGLPSEQLRQLPKFPVRPDLSPSQHPERKDCVTFMLHTSDLCSVARCIVNPAMRSI